MKEEYVVNGRVYIIPELTLEMDEKLIDFFGEFIEGGEFNIAKIINLIRNKRKHRELITILLIPKKKRFRDYFKHDLLDNWKDLKHLTNDQLEEIWTDFFGESGPMQTVSRLFSPKDEETLDLKLKGSGE